MDVVPMKFFCSSVNGHGLESAASETIRRLPCRFAWSESLDLTVPRMLSTVYYFSVASIQQSDSDVVSLMEITCFKYDMDSVFHDRCFVHP